jgi:hypothetical protein
MSARVIAYSVLLPSSVAKGILAFGGSGGTLVIRRREGEKLLVCTGAGNAHGEAAESQSSFVRTFRGLDASVIGAWFRADTASHDLWDFAIHRNLTVPTSVLKSHLKVQAFDLHNQNATLVLTVVEDESGNPDVRSWWVNSETAWPYSMDEYDEDADPFDLLRPGWSLDVLAQKRITMVGLGSIGSAAFEVLLSYGLRRFTLVDPQRLQQRNLSRHRLGRNDVGRFKVAALKERYGDRYPSVEIEVLALDVELSADVMRPLFEESDLVLASPDGVVPRRVVSHLARRASIPAVFAAVLDDGRIGEVLRLRPDCSVGCLTCQRAQLEDDGGMDLEQRIDRGYSEATIERPMTAVGGDLWLVGCLAAKVAVATLLEQEGEVDQRLPGDHAVIGLRPASDLTVPFAASGPTDLHWRQGGPPREGCPTCFPGQRAG